MRDHQVAGSVAPVCGARLRGSILITALAFALVVAVITAGVATLAVAHYSRAVTESSYAMALDNAEAGVNYELRKISDNPTQADGIGTGSGASYSAPGTGTYQLYCTNRDNTTPWTAGSNLYVIATGAVNGAQRTIKVAARGVGGSGGGQYALFGVAASTISGTAGTVNGDVGTNATLSFAGHPTINGKVIFNGPGSGWADESGGAYTVVNNTSAVIWPTVESIANAAFPAGGLSYVASHNDNALANPPISGNSIGLTGHSSVTLVGKLGGANYYLTSLSMTGQSDLTFDNTNGPITIWFGPAGSGAGTFSMKGGSASIKMSSDSTKPVRIYIAATCEVDLAGNSELDAGIYNVNASQAGEVVIGGTPTVYGSVISNSFDMHGNATVNYVSGMFTNPAPAYYGFDNSWQEINGVWN